MRSTKVGRVQAFGEKKRIKISFDDLDLFFFEKLLDYYFEDEKTQYINTYVRKNIRFIQQFLNWATKKGYNKNLAYKDWRLETGTKRENTEGNIISLSITEFFAFYDLKPEYETMQRTRDYLILACSKGLRYSDIANLKKTDIDYDRGLISCTTIKTSDHTVIPFNDFSKEVLLKYQQTSNYNSKGVEMAFQTISIQKTSEALKELAKKAGLTQMVPIFQYRRNKRVDTVLQKHDLISSHIGLKTFITFAVWLGIPSEITMKFTTHRNHATMERYYDCKDESSLAMKWGK